MECVPDYVTTFNGITPSVTKSTNKKYGIDYPEKNFIDIGHKARMPFLMMERLFLIINLQCGLCLTET